MAGQRVCVWECPAERLEAGSIVVSGGAARYLKAKVRTVCGYDEWSYIRYEADGTPHMGRMSVRLGGSVSVVALGIGGAVIVP